MPFEVFTRTRSRITAPAVSIGQHGQVIFNKPLTTKLIEMNAVQILLLYDRAKRIIALRVTKDDYRAYEFRINEKQNSTHFHAKPFFDTIHYDLSKNRQFPVKYNATGEIKQWEIELDNNCFVKEPAK